MSENFTEEQLQADILKVQQIGIVPNLLNVVCRTTQMRFAAVARVTENRWITCMSLDELNFGLKPGDELKIETTICNEIQQTHQEVIIDDVDKSPVYCNHHTPAMYGFKSYISVPIFKKDGKFFGTLCAIDPLPAKLDTPEIRDMFKLFADLIAFHLQVVEQLNETKSALWKEREERSQLLEQKNAELQVSNAELEAFTYVASHDLQEPLRKIQTYADKLMQSEVERLSDNGKFYFTRMLKSSSRMQRLLNDLLTYTRVSLKEHNYKPTDITAIIDEIKQDYKDDQTKKNFTIIIDGEMCKPMAIPFQLNQLFRNLISNSIKFSKENINAEIRISSSFETEIQNNNLDPTKKYCHIAVVDNGIGFDQQFSEEIFKIFKRLHGNHAFEGTGVGLAIVKKIVDNHYGHITAYSKENEGARFDIYLPQNEA